MSRQEILQTTTFNIKEKIGTKSLKWCNDIQLYFQDKCAQETLKEIIKMVKLNKLTIKLKIKLETGKLFVYYGKVDSKGNLSTEDILISKRKRS